jgi:hypothetical protein
VVHEVEQRAAVPCNATVVPSIRAIASLASVVDAVLVDLPGRPSPAVSTMRRWRSSLAASAAVPRLRHAGACARGLRVW